MTFPGTKLNVIFHGMFAFVIWDDRVEVLAPQEEDHVYKSGSWGRERRLREGSVYSLEGAFSVGHPPSVDAKQNLVVRHWTPIERDREVLFSAIQLPFPQSTTGLRRVKVDPNRPLFGGTAAQGGDPATLPLVQVFTYETENVTNLKLSPLTTWIPEPDAQGFVNLHIWAESECLFTKMEQDHPRHAFECLMRLFPGQDLKLLY